MTLLTIGLLAEELLNCSKQMSQLSEDMLNRKQCVNNSQSKSLETIFTSSLFTDVLFVYQAQLT